MAYNSAMHKRVMIEGESFSLYKGKFAKVVARLAYGLRGWEVRQVIGGKRVRKVFAFDALREANNYARAAEAERLTHGAAAAMRDDDRLAISFYRRWEDELRAQGQSVPSLFQLVQEACSRFENRLAAATWEQAAESYIEARAGHLKPQRRAVVLSVLERFGDSLPRPDVLLDDISTADVQAGLASFVDAKATDTTRRAYLTILASVWTLAMERKLATFNPAHDALKRMPAAKKGEQPSFLLVPACESLLRVAWQHKDRREALFFVVGLLTGIRLAERARLQFADFRLDEPTPYINVPAGKAKTLRQRAVYLMGTHADIIRAFMPRDATPEEVIIPYGGNETTQRGAAYARQQAFAKLAEIDLPRNVLRHTAATYLCAYLESMGKAALILGHSESMLVQHYRALVTKAEADRFFSLTVPGAGN